MNIHTITSQDSYDNTYLSSNPPDNSGNLQYTTSTSSKLRSKSAVKPTNSSQIDLQSVISQYQGNPELLRLILSSKVEEDKRRTEEAKLKTKELDLYIKTQNSTTNSSSRADNRANRNLYSDSILGFQHRRSSSSSISSTSSTTGGSIHRRINPYSTPVCHTRPITVAPQRRNSAGISIYSINNNINQATSSVPISKSASIPLDSPYSQSLTYEK